MSYAVVSSFSGASKTTVNIGGIDYDVYEFSSVGGGSITFSQPGDVDYLITGPGGGGGSGGFTGNGGGSAGDVLVGATQVNTGNYPVAVGASGGPRNAGLGNSSFAGLTAILGGRGRDNGTGTLQGGGGLGGANNSVTFAGASHPSGFRGGDGFLSPGTQAQQIGGGGRGAGGDGGNANRTTLLPGDGGPGIVSDITGVSIEYGRGGGGGARQTKTGGGTPNGGFAGPGGDGATPGSGGGGGTTAGGAGANGVVIVRVRASGPAPEPIVADSSGSVDFTGESLAVNLIVASSEQVFEVSGTSASAVSILASGASSYEILGSSNASVGAVEVVANVSGSISFEGNSSGSLTVVASGSGSINLSGTSTTQVLIEASSEGTIDLSGTATAVLSIQGQASGQIDFVGSTSGLITISGEVSGELMLSGLSTGISGALSPMVSIPGRWRFNLALSEIKAKELQGSWKRTQVNGRWRSA